MRSGGGRLVILMATVLSAACGLAITGSALDEPSDGADATVDAGASENVDGPTDAAAAGDAGDASDATTATRFCATLAPRPTFCEDFDTDASSVGGAWDSVLSAPQRTTTVWASAPAALDAVSQDGGPTVLEKAFTVNASITIELDVRYVALPATGAVTPFILRPANGNGGWFYLYSHLGRSYLQVGGDEFSAPQTPEPATGTWHHVSATMTIDGGATVFTGSLDHVAYTWSITKSGHPWAAGTSAILQIGMNPWQTTGELYVDNVFVTAR
jgi:hypothetical protein